MFQKRKNYFLKPLGKNNIGVEIHLVYSQITKESEC